MWSAFAILFMICWWDFLVFGLMLQGLPLTDSFNISCLEWKDVNGSSAGIKYNFIYDDLMFLQDSYDLSSTVSTVAGVGNHSVTAVILDEYSLPTCCTVTIETFFANNSGFLFNLENSTLSNVTDGLIRTFNDLVDGATESNNSNIVVELSLITDTIYDLAVVYTTTEACETALSTMTTTESNSQLSELQSEIISGYLTNVVDHVTNIQDAVTVLAILTEISVPLIDTNNTEIASLYNASIIELMIDVIDDPIISLFRQSILSGEIESLDADTAQFVFG